MEAATALVEAGLIRLVFSVVVAFWAAAKARSPKAVRAVKKRMLTVTAFARSA